MENMIKGVRTITIHDDSRTVLDFADFAEAARHFDDLYANAVEEDYAEEVLFPILLAAQNEEYDYIDEDGYAVIEQDATGIFEEVEEPIDGEPLEEIFGIGAPKKEIHACAVGVKRIAKDIIKSKFYSVESFVNALVDFIDRETSAKTVALVENPGTDKYGNRVGIFEDYVITFTCSSEEKYKEIQQAVIGGFASRFATTGKFGAEATKSGETTLRDRVLIWRYDYVKPREYEKSKTRAKKDAEKARKQNKGKKLYKYAIGYDSQKISISNINSALTAAKIYKIDDFETVRSVLNSADFEGRTFGTLKPTSVVVFTCTEEQCEDFRKRLVGKPDYYMIIKSRNPVSEELEVLDGEALEETADNWFEQEW